MIARTHPPGQVQRGFDRPARVTNASTVGRSKKHAAALLPAVRHPGRVWRLLSAKDAPKGPKLVLLFALLYVLMPVDLIPDMAPVITWLDDLGVVALAIGYVAKKAAEQKTLDGASSS